MNNATEYLELHLVKGTCNQLNDVNKYIEDAENHSTCVREYSVNGNEVFTFKDGSVIVRIDDEAFTYKDIEDYR